MNPCLLYPRLEDQEASRWTVWTQGVDRDQAAPSPKRSGPLEDDETVNGPFGWVS